MTTSRISRSLVIMPRTFVVVLLSVLLVLSSTIAHAAWTVSTQAAGSGANHNIALASTGINTPANHVYTAANTPNIRNVVLSNSGSLTLPVTRLAIASTGTLAGSRVALTVWARSGQTCGTSVPGTGVAKFISTLSSQPQAALPAGLITVPASGSVQLCVATSIANIANLSGNSITTSLTFTGVVGGWTVSDAAPRTFTQSVFQVVCNNEAGYGLQLTWPSFGTSYELEMRKNGAWVSASTNVTSPQEVTNHTSGVEIGTGATHLRIKANTSTGPVLSDAIPIHYEDVFLWFIRIDTTPKCGA